MYVCIYNLTIEYVLLLLYIYIYEFLLCLSECIISTFFFPGEKDTTHSMFFDALPAPAG